MNRFERYRPGNGWTSAGRWWRPIAVLLLIQLVGAGCMGGVRAPRNAIDTEQFLRRYEEQLTEAGSSPPTSSSQTPGAQAPVPTALSADDEPTVRSPQGPETVRSVTELSIPSEYSSWKTVAGVPDYRIGPADLLEVTAFVGPDISGASLRVQGDGTIWVPRFQIGPVEAAGMAPGEVASRLTARYQEFAPAAHVQVEVAEHRAWNATALGELRIGTAGSDLGPGDYPLAGRTTVSEFIYDHGGPTEDADMSNVRLIRDGQEYRIDLATSSGVVRRELDPVIDDGDMIVVPSRQVAVNRFYVLGEVRNPGMFTLTENTTILDAISQAGSFTEDADLASINISRPGSGAPRSIAVNLDNVLRHADFAQNFQLQPGDYVLVPAKPPGFFERAREYFMVSQLVISIITIIELTNDGR